MFRDLIQNINLRCSNLGRTLPRTVTASGIGHSTGPWNKNKYYPDCAHRAVLPSLLLETNSSKGAKIPISTHKETGTRTRSVRLVLVGEHK